MKCVAGIAIFGIACGGPQRDEREAPPPPIALKSDQVLVAPTQLKLVSGQRGVAPDDQTKLEFQQMPASRLVGSFKLCLDEAGNPTEVEVVRSTNLDASDQKIMRAMHRWAFAPYIVDGSPHAVCTVQTFIYSQR